MIPKPSPEVFSPSHHLRRCQISLSFSLLYDVFCAFYASCYVSCVSSSSFSPISFLLSPLSLQLNFPCLLQDLVMATASSVSSSLSLSRLQRRPQHHDFFHFFWLSQVMLSAQSMNVLFLFVPFLCVLRETLSVVFSFSPFFPGSSIGIVSEHERMAWIQGTVTRKPAVLT